MKPKLRMSRSWASKVMGGARAYCVADGWMAEVTIPVTSFNVPVMSARVAMQGPTKRLAMAALLKELQRIRAGGNLRNLEGHELKVL